MVNIKLLIHPFSDRWVQRAVAVVFLLCIALLVLTAPVSGYAGLGGYISEKLLSRTAGVTASLYLGDSTSGPTVIGAGPAISTSTTSGVATVGGVATATLSGVVSNLNGFPRADTWFTWGYAPGALTNTTATVTVTGTGYVTTTITGYDPGAMTVYYQFVSSTDGTSLGGVNNFRTNPLSSGTGADYWLLWNLLSVAVGMGMFVLIIRLARGGSWVAVLLVAMIGLATVALINSLLPTLWR